MVGVAGTYARSTSHERRQRPRHFVEDVGSDIAAVDLLDGPDLLDVESRHQPSPAASAAGSPGSDGARRAPRRQRLQLDEARPRVTNVAEEAGHAEPHEDRDETE